MLLRYIKSTPLAPSHLTSLSSETAVVQASKMLRLNSFDRIVTIFALLSCFILVQLPHSNADASNQNPTGEGCVDPQGYLSCYAAQVKQAAFCTETVNKTCDAQQINNCIAGCYGAQLAGNIGCWIQSCWNKVCWNFTNYESFN